MLPTGFAADWNVENTNFVGTAQLNRRKQRKGVLIRRRMKRTDIMVTIDFYETGLRIDKFRNEAGLTVREMQDIFGFGTPQAIYKWLRGKSLPSLDNFVILASILGKTIDDILVVKEM